MVTQDLLDYSNVRGGKIAQILSKKSTQKSKHSHFHFLPNCFLILSHTFVIANVLAAIPVDELKGIKTQEQFRNWFEHWLNVLASLIHELHQGYRRIYPGYKWGHGTKVLTLYLREIVLNSRYFQDSEVGRIVPFLYIPIDDIVMKRFKKLGHRLPFHAINQVDTPEKFYDVQDLLGQAAAEVGVPRIWFDDNRGDRH